MRGRSAMKGVWARKWYNSAESFLSAILLLRTPPSRTWARQYVEVGMMERHKRSQTSVGTTSEREVTLQGSVCTYHALTTAAEGSLETTEGVPIACKISVLPKAEEILRVRLPPHKPHQYPRSKPPLRTWIRQDPALERDRRASRADKHIRTIYSPVVEAAKE